MCLGNASRLGNNFPLRHAMSDTYISLIAQVRELFYEGQLNQLSVPSIWMSPLLRLGPGNRQNPGYNE